jgi:transcriptional regulator with XRE-family HTH domain
MREARKLTRFGKAVKVRMLDTGIKQKQLAAMVGASESMICAVLYGDRSEERWIAPICAALGMNATRFGGARRGA